MLLLLATALAFDTSLDLAVDPGMRVFIDGEDIAGDRDNDRLIVHRTDAGTHTLRILDGRGRPLVDEQVHLPRGYRVSCEQSGQALTCPAAVVRHHDPVDSPTWGLDDGLVLTVHTGGHELAVWIDGKRAVALTQEPLAYIRLEPGRRHLSLRKPGSDRGFADGEIETGEREAIALSLNEAGQPVWADGLRWASGGGAGVPTVGRPTLTDVGGMRVRMHDMDQPGVTIAGLSDPWADQAVPSALDGPSVQLLVESLDGTWADVLVDGEVVAEIRESGRDEVDLPQRDVPLAVRTFLADAPYASGTLELTGRKLVHLQLNATEPPRTASGVGLDLEEAR